MKRNKSGGGLRREHQRPEGTWDELLDQSQGTEARDDAAIVIYVGSARCRAVYRDDEIDVVVPSGIAVKQKSALAVGDRITVSGEAGAWRLETILPRHSVLARPDPLRPHMQRLIAANIDVVVHVVSVKAPPLANVQLRKSG